MTSRVDIDRLAALLEADPADAPDGEDRQLSLLASALRQAAPEPVTMRADARADLRAKVLQAAREQTPESPLLTRMRERVERMRHSAGFATGTGIAAMTLSMGGVAGAAELAGPGDLLYGVKLQIEDARLALTGDDVARGERAVSYAFDRLAEARTAAQEGRDADAARAITGATGRMADASDRLMAAGLTAPLQALDEDVRSQEALLVDLRPLLGEEGTAAAEELTATLTTTRHSLADVLQTDPLSAPPADPLGSIDLPGVSATPPPEMGVPSSTPLPDGPGAGPTPDQPGSTLPVPGLPAVPGLPPLPLPVPGPTAPAVSAPADTSTTTVPEVLQDVGGLVDDTVEAVSGQVQQTLPPVADPVVPALGSLADGVADTASDALGTVEGAVDALLGGG